MAGPRCVCLTSCGRWLPFHGLRSSHNQNPEHASALGPVVPLRTSQEHQQHGHRLGAASNCTHRRQAESTTPRFAMLPQPYRYESLMPKALTSCWEMTTAAKAIGLDMQFTGRPTKTLTHVSILFSLAVSGAVYLGATYPPWTHICMKSFTFGRSRYAV